MKKLAGFIFAAILFLSLWASYGIIAQASSHRDGVIVSSDPKVDLTDTYIFRTDYTRNVLGVGNYNAGTGFDLSMEVSGTYLVMITGDTQSVTQTGPETLNIKTKNIEHWCGSSDSKLKNKNSTLGFSKNPSYLVVDAGWPSGNILPAGARGLWVSTNASDWEILPSTNSVRIKLTGKPDIKGTFKIFWPNSLLKKWGLNASNIAAFYNSNRITASVQKAAGGLIINTSMPFGDTNIFSSGKAMPLSLTASKEKTKKNRRVKLYGWINPKKKGVLVSILRKLQGEHNYKQVAQKKTNSAGYYEYSEQLSKTASFKAAATNGKKKLSSRAKKITVN